MSALLAPGAHRAAGVTGDDALVRAVLRVEVAWLSALADGGAAGPDDVAAVATAARTLDGARPDPEQVEAAANPVLPLLRMLRREVVGPAAALVHAGLTSQDVLDTALVLLACDAADRVLTDLAAVADALGGLAADHRGSVMAGRTLTQHAVPVTFGLKAAQWLVAVLDAAQSLQGVRDRLPVQCGGAAGTLARAAELVPDPLRAARVLAEQLGLQEAALPWHTRRAPLTRLADALVECCDALGVVAADVLLLGRPEVAEVREGASPGRGGSSTMPHKRNPVLAVLVRSAALQAPALAAGLHASAAASVDERPDGAWQAEWPVLQRLLELAVTAASQGAELVAGLEVDAGVMAHRARGAADLLLAERRATRPRGAARPAGAGEAPDDAGDPAGYLGVTDALVERALARLADREADRA